MIHSTQRFRHLRIHTQYEYRCCQVIFSKSYFCDKDASKVISNSRTVNVCFQYIEYVTQYSYKFKYSKRTPISQPVHVSTDDMIACRFAEHIKFIENQLAILSPFCDTRHQIYFCVVSCVQAQAQQKNICPCVF